MKSVENAEFILMKKIQLLKEKHKDIPELSELEEETREIINQNCISSVQMAMMYLMSSEKILDAETHTKIKNILQSVLNEQSK